MTEYEQEMERLSRIGKNDFKELPCAIQNVFHAVGISSKQQVIDFLNAGGDLKRFTNIGEKHEVTIRQWAKSETPPTAQKTI